MRITSLILIPFLSAAAVWLPVSDLFRIRLFSLTVLYHLILTASCWYRLPVAEYQGYLVLDHMGLLLLSVISLLFTAVAVYMRGYFAHEHRSARTLTSCLLLLLSMMSLASVSYHMGLMWVAIESTTLFSAPLISFHRTKESLDATWKYLLVCSVGIALALMGTFFLAIAVHDIGTLLLPAILNGSPHLSADWLKISIIFLLVGYGCKLGLAPMHSWKPEAYGHATGMVSVVMAGGLTQCSFLALFRVSQICSRTGLEGFYASILIVTGVLSLAVAAGFILAERNLKRAFAYSSIEHMGILVLGLALGGVGLLGALFHMINNALAKVIMFLTAGSIAQKYGSSRIDDVRGVIRTYPVTGILLLAGLFAGTGMFPFATFRSELMVLNSAVKSGHYILAGGIVVCLALIFIGMCRVVLEMAHGEPTEPLLPKKENSLMNAPIIAAVILLIGLSLWMPTALDMAIRAAAGMTGVH